MKKKARISRWERVQGNCKYIQPCDCGENELCYHPKGEYDRCYEEVCPTIKELKRKAAKRKRNE